MPDYQKKGMELKELNEPESRKRQALVLITFLLMLLAVAGIGISWMAFRDTLDGHYQAGLQAFEEDDLDTVAAEAKRLENVTDYAPHRHLLEGMLLLRQNRLLDAVSEFELAKDHPDTQARALALLGETFYRMARLSSAEQFLVTAVTVDPTLTSAHRWLGRIYYDIGAMNHAIAELKSVASQDPHDPQPHRLIGSIYKNFEEYEEAKAAYRESLRRGPKQPDVGNVWSELAECLMEQTAYDEALKTLSHCPDSARTKTLKAKCHYANSNRDKTWRLVDSALEADPDFLPALQLRATLQIEADQVDDAVKGLERAVEKHPFDHELRQQLAEAYKQLGKHDLAEMQSQERKRLERIVEEVDQLRLQAVEDPNDVEVRYQLGVLARQLGQWERAERWFRIALAMNPNHERARQAIEQEANPLSTESRRP